MRGRIGYVEVVVLRICMTEEDGSEIGLLVQLRQEGHEEFGHRGALRMVIVSDCW